MSPLSFCFTRTLISCGFLGPGPIRWWIATSAACMKVHHNISDLQRACFRVQQGWVQAGCWAAFAVAYSVFDWTWLHCICNSISVSVCHAKQAKDCNLDYFIFLTRLKITYILLCLTGEECGSWCVCWYILNSEQSWCGVNPLISSITSTQHKLYWFI